jgi:5-methylcytosine-specific restriction endonuclease McrA
MPKTKEQHNAYMREYLKQYTRARRQAWIESQGNCCNYCGITGVPFDIDHINRADKNINIAGNWTRKKSLIEAELAKCQVLCKPCHRDKTRSETFIANPDHGTHVMYRHRACRCDECKAWKSQNNKRYRLRLKAKEQGNG